MPESATCTPSKTVVSPGLSAHLPELCSALLSETAFGPRSTETVWLRHRYQELIPAILPDVVRCIDLGEALTRTSLEVVRASAMATHNREIALADAVRLGIPAVRGFSAFILATDHGLSERDLVIVMGRASLILYELGACWTEAWNLSREAGRSVRPVAGTVESPALEMLALVANGQSNDQIAMALDYSPQAVKWHLARIMRSWKVVNRASLVAAAFLRGVLCR